MIVDVSKIVNGIADNLELNRYQIDTLVNLYQKGGRLNVFKGERKTIPNTAYPAVEIEPESADWL